MVAVAKGLAALVAVSPPADAEPNGLPLGACVL